MEGLDLFDSVGEDLRPQIREHRDDKLRAYLIEEGIYNITLQEYAEWVVCDKPFAELTEHEIREVGRHIYRGKYGYEFLPYDAPLQEHIALIQDKIAYRIEIYKETGGRYGSRGRLALLKRKEQAKRLGLIDDAEIVW